MLQVFTERNFLRQLIALERSLKSLVEFLQQSYLSRYTILFDMKNTTSDVIPHNDFQKLR